jgi:prophage tail gpP-like protein
MHVPDRSSHRDVHSESDVPRISEQNLKNYLHGFDSELKDEAINLYREKFLIYVRHALSGEL